MIGILPSNAFQKARTLASATGLIPGPPRPPNPPFGLITADSRSGSITSALPTELISERKSRRPLQDLGHRGVVGGIEIRRQLDAQRAIHDGSHAADQSLRGLEVIPDLRLAGDVRTGEIHFDEIGAGASDRPGDLRKVVLAEARHACDHRLLERL